MLLCLASAGTVNEYQNHTVVVIPLAHHTHRCALFKQRVLSLKKKSFVDTGSLLPYFTSFLCSLDLDYGQRLENQNWISFEVFFFGSPIRFHFMWVLFEAEIELKMLKILWLGQCCQKIDTNCLFMILSTAVLKAILPFASLPLALHMPSMMSNCSLYRLHLSKYRTYLTILSKQSVLSLMVKNSKSESA